MANKEPPTASVGAIEKACRVLKALTDGRNTRLVDIAGYCGLDKATTMRVLDTLIREQLVERDPQTRRYRLGPEVARLAKGVSEPVDWRELARPSLMRLSGAFEDTTSTRSPTRRKPAAVMITRSSPVRPDAMTNPWLLVSDTCTARRSR